MTRPQLAHLGISVIDIHAMTAFYQDVFGLHVTDKGKGLSFPRDLVFMSNSPGQHHQFVLASGRDPQHPSTIFQISFKVADLGELRVVRDRALGSGATKMIVMSHGNAISIYFNDIEGNVVEAYLDTPWQIAQPHGDPINLDLSDEEIWASVESVCRADPTFSMADDWAATFPT